MKSNILSLLFFALWVLGACSTTRPCSEGGDTTWNGESLKGDKVCGQQPNREGLWVNHGRYIQKHNNGKVMIEGQYEDGKKQGIWSRYDETGNKTVEKYFENGVEKPVLPHIKKK